MRRTRAVVARSENGNLMNLHHLKKRLPAAVAAAVLVSALAGCGSDDTESATDTTGSSSASADSGGETEAEAAAVSVTDPWVKATDEDMSAAFGVLVNEGDSDVTLVGATYEGAGQSEVMVELHETVQNDDGSMAMQAKDGGFVIPAGGEHLLEPGGDHIMLMALTAPLEAGDAGTIVLEFADGSTSEVEATIKPFDGADEQYQDGES